MNRPPPTDITIALVEDERVLRQEMAFQLEHLGFAVDTFENAAQFYRALVVQSKTIAVLDIGLSGEDGLSICQHLRSHDSQMGIVFVTARVLREDRLIGLAAGADAYLSKPVDMEELVLILQRLSRRFSPEIASVDPVDFPEDASWRMENDASFVRAPNGVRVRLSINEAQLLRLLLHKAGKACSHAELGLALGLPPDELDRHRLEVILSRLRLKAERLTGIRLPLVSCRGFGYRIER
jgi:DNA-binding response OmpR family regulator